MLVLYCCKWCTCWFSGHWPLVQLKQSWFLWRTGKSCHAAAELRQRWAICYLRCYKNIQPGENKLKDLQQVSTVYLFTQIITALKTLAAATAVAPVRFYACLKWVIIDIGNAKKIKSEQAKFWNKPINLGNEQECSCKNVFFAEDGGMKTWVISYLEQMLNFEFFFIHMWWGSWKCASGGGGVEKK